MGAVFSTSTFLTVCFLLIFQSICAACQNAETEAPIEARSLENKPLRRMVFEAERLAKLTADLETARMAAESDPTDPHKLIWVGRRSGYLWRYNDAIDKFSAGIAAHPDVPHLYRHRGHRYISIRKFDLAIADLTKAANLIDGAEDEVEPDGAPNAAGIPTGTLHSNIWYHLGLAHYLSGDFERALSAYEKCLAVSKNDDMLVATLDWMYMTLRRLDRVDEATRLLESIKPEMNILENHAYHRRLLMYKGELQIQDLLPAKDSESYDLDLATYGYGIGNWYLVNGETEKAMDTFRQVTAGEYWSAFGFIASEADLFRLDNVK